MQEVTDSAVNGGQHHSAVNGGQHQSIARLDLLLSALSGSPDDGLKLTDVCRITGLNKATAHRLLAGLVTYRLADHDEMSGRYFVGLKIIGWARAAENRHGLLRLFQPALHRLAQRFGDVVYRSMRVGDDSACVARIEGPFPIKSLALNVGDRRPLGIGSIGLAMLAALPDREVERIMADGQAARRAYRISDDELRSMVVEARRTGYAAVDGLIVPGICTVGVPVLRRDGTPVAGISMSAIRDRMDPSRQAIVAQAIAEEIAEVGAAGL
ncbi:IclR family transcriptional regulator [Azospirillum canadense]|uniref:IclR family transcriptional regulator n=1 Tax=Azospirillum canadense TaxID=403962 RepID=UPI002226EE15|nr:IclR family transcriptional regulator [Azospirillum canadense]MCW2241760.1 DNA-binding IclR family transcriptional regulator [Azospirillum canadense]